MNHRLQRLVEWAERYPVMPLLAILLIGLLPRVIMLPTAGFALDLVQSYDWGRCANQNALFGMYQCPSAITHPPISATLFGAGLWLLAAIGRDISYFQNNALVITVLKLPILMFEIALVSLAYYVVYKRAGVKRAMGVAAALNFNPGWLVVTAWWGQDDAIYTFLMLLMAYLMAERRVRWAWFVYGIAWLAKFQSIIFLPVLVVLTFRRHGWKATLEGLVVYLLVFGAGLLPFLVGSGASALTPFVGTVNLFPYITNGAFNMWFWVSGSSKTVLLDTTPLFGSVSYFQVGLLLLALGTALVCLRAWLLPERDEVYLLLAAANLIFFMLPTQIQIRYLYPGLVFLAVAMARNWKLVALYIGLSITFTYNVFSIVWLGIGILYYPFKLMIWTPTENALAVTLFFVAFMWLLLQPLRPLIKLRHQVVQPQ